MAEDNPTPPKKRKSGRPLKNRLENVADIRRAMAKVYDDLRLGKISEKTSDAMTYTLRALLDAHTGKLTIDLEEALKTLNALKKEPQ